MRRLVPFVAGAALLGATFLPATVRADDQDVIDYREHIMKTMGETVGAMQMVIQNKAPADNFPQLVQVLAITAASAEKAFGPKVVGGEAKAEIWSNAADFSKRMKELAANTADLAVAAKSGGVAAVQPKMQAALTCKGCHDTYRQQKKK